MTKPYRAKAGNSGGFWREQGPGVSARLVCSEDGTGYRLLTLLASSLSLTVTCRCAMTVSSLLKRTARTGEWQEGPGSGWFWAQAPWLTCCPLPQGTLRVWPGQRLPEHRALPPCFQHLQKLPGPVLLSHTLFHLSHILIFIFPHFVAHPSCYPARKAGPWGWSGPGPPGPTLGPAAPVPGLCCLPALCLLLHAG